LRLHRVRHNSSCAGGGCVCVCVYAILEIVFT
jgi:hypothetical protein